MQWSRAQSYVAEWDELEIPSLWVQILPVPMGRPWESSFCQVTKPIIWKTALYLLFWDVIISKHAYTSDAPPEALLKTDS